MQTQTINISLPSGLMDELDLLAKKEFRNRSELIREAVRSYIREEREWEELFTYGQKQARKLGIRKEEDADKIVQAYRQGK